jgi:hypothetical protein
MDFISSLPKLFGNIGFEEEEEEEESIRKQK